MIMKEPMSTTVTVLLLIIILVLVGINCYNTGYTHGQIDYMNGKIKVRKVTDTLTRIEYLKNK